MVLEFQRPSRCERCCFIYLSINLEMRTKGVVHRIDRFDKHLANFFQFWPYHDWVGPADGCATRSRSQNPELSRHSASRRRRGGLPSGTCPTDARQFNLFWKLPRNSDNISSKLSIQRISNGKKTLYKVKRLKHTFLKQHNFDDFLLTFDERCKRID